MEGRSVPLRWGREDQKEHDSRRYRGCVVWLGLRVDCLNLFALASVDNCIKVFRELDGAVEELKVEAVFHQWIDSRHAREQASPSFRDDLHLYRFRRRAGCSS